MIYDDAFELLGGFEIDKVYISSYDYSYKSPIEKLNSITEMQPKIDLYRKRDIDRGRRHNIKIGFELLDEYDNRITLEFDSETRKATNYAGTIRKSVFNESKFTRNYIMTMTYDIFRDAIRSDWDWDTWKEAESKSKSTFSRIKDFLSFKK
jgi:ribosomal protein S17E